MSVDGGLFRLLHKGIMTMASDALTQEFEAVLSGNTPLDVDDSSTAAPPDGFELVPIMRDGQPRGYYVKHVPSSLYWSPVGSLVPKHVCLPYPTRDAAGAAAVSAARAIAKQQQAAANATTQPVVSDVSLSLPMDSNAAPPNKPFKFAGSLDETETAKFSAVLSAMQAKRCQYAPGRNVESPLDVVRFILMRLPDVSDLR